MVYGITAYNKRFTLRPLRGLGFRKTPVGLTPFVVFCSSTFFCARKNASHFSLSGTKKRHKQPKRYMPLHNYLKNA
jgi:hypothetical protein